LETNQSGLVSEINAMTIFRQSQLDESRLLSLFSLVDRQRRGSLDSDEFCMGFHIIVLLGKQILTSPPSILPAGLVQSCSSTPQIPPPVPPRRKPAVPPRR
jgi:hypothetical protein